jgi:hypothetical protein
MQGMLAAMVSCLPTGGVRYHLFEYSSTNRPTNARELFNLRHSSLRVTVERAFGALKNRFRILYNKPFHLYKTQVKLVLAYCILHNWILGFGLDPIVPNEDWLPPNTPPIHPEDLASLDIVAMTERRDEICNAMWAGRGSHRT